MSQAAVEQHLAALHRLDRWKAVRPESSWLGYPTGWLEDAHLTLRVTTVLGDALVVHPSARAFLGQTRRGVSDTVAANALYQQDSEAELRAAGFTRLRPGKGVYRVVDNANGVPCPLVGQLTFRGYSRRYLLTLLESLEINLMTQRATLVALYPAPPPTIVHRQLTLVYAPPRWADLYRPQ